MANETSFDYFTGETLYSCRFQPDGNVFITDGSADEIWGAGGHTAADYAVTMAENGAGGHFVGDFDPDGEIAASGEVGYPVAVFLKDGINPADGDIALGRGDMHWDGEAEISLSTVYITNNTVINNYDETITVEGGIPQVTYTK